MNKYRNDNDPRNVSTAAYVALVEQIRDFAKKHAKPSRQTERRLLFEKHFELCSGSRRERRNLARAFAARDWVAGSQERGKFFRMMIVRVS